MKLNQVSTVPFTLTLLTPTYNRRQELEKLHQSIEQQTVGGFQWLIVDDGSEDQTGKEVAAWKSDSYTLYYVRKENGGKHTALNYSHPFIRGEWVCIVDSDDVLVPNAVSVILDAIKQYGVQENIKCLSFQRGWDESTPICQGFPEKDTVSNHIDFRVNARRSGDCCEVVKTEMLKSFPFPVIPEEHFMGEGYLWNRIGFRYDTVYINRIIYITNYLEGGLTKNGRAMRVKCPYSGMENCNSFFENMNGRHVCLRIRCKEALLFITYGKFAGLCFQAIICKSASPGLITAMYGLGLLMYRIWKWRYAS